MAETSLNNFFNFDNQRKWEGMKEMILCYVLTHPYRTQAEFEEVINKPLHTFSGRYSDLARLGLIEKCGIAKVFTNGRDGDSFHMWKCTVKGEQKAVEILTESTYTN